MDIYLFSPFLFQCLVRDFLSYCTLLRSSSFIKSWLRFVKSGVIGAGLGFFCFQERSEPGGSIAGNFFKLQRQVTHAAERKAAGNLAQGYLRVG